ncbi:hypothetical protein Bca52824_024457 [Brassica carinata]|uniref:Uncharacterized protein n=1 Tax=Brassica carinata TaxID=52824 RepID=A0A8X7VL71_BRACI|nr:hypothetical protein Bca52824_024457 [Brassica carinata]
MNETGESSHPDHIETIGYGSITSSKVNLPPSDYIYFKVGFINKKLDIFQFKIVHSCKIMVPLDL